MRRLVVGLFAAACVIAIVAATKFKNPIPLNAEGAPKENLHPGKSWMASWQDSAKIALKKSSDPLPKLRTHTVLAGENDWIIAKHAGVSVSDLHAANPNVNWLRLQIGQSVLLPSGSLGSSPKVAPVSRPDKVAKKASSPARTYVVRAGDNDWVIAKRLNVTAAKLRTANPGVKWTRLQIGQQLLIPEGARAPSGESAGSRTKVAQIKRDNVNIRRGPGTNHASITMTQEGTTVAVLARSGDWVQARFPRGTVGWVRADMLRPVQSSRVARSGSKEPSSKTKYAIRSASSPNRVAYNPATGNAIVDRALALQGVRYRYGSASRSGTDCSGLTTQVFKSLGVSLPRRSRDQSAVGASVPKSSLRPGDMVFFRTNRSSRVNHVGIYVGDGKFVHASSSKGRVRVDSLNDGYYQRRYVTGRRVLSAKAAAAARKAAEAAKRKAAEEEKSLPKAEDPKAKEKPVTDQ